LVKTGGCKGSPILHPLRSNGDGSDSTESDTGFKGCAGAGVIDVAQTNVMAVYCCTRPARWSACPKATWDRLGHLLAWNDPSLQLALDPSVETVNDGGTDGRIDRGAKRRHTRPGHGGAAADARDREFRLRPGRRRSSGAEDTTSTHQDKGYAMLLPRSYPVARLLFEGYAAALLGLVIVALLTPAVVRAREAAQRAVCTNVLRQHSGCHPVVVHLEGGRIVRVSSCWGCNYLHGVRINFVDEKDGKPLESEQAIQEGLALLRAALDRGEFSIPDNPFPGGHRVSGRSQAIRRIVTDSLLTRLETELRLSSALVR
jgi:hypothetical protein